MVWREKRIGEKVVVVEKKRIDEKAMVEDKKTESYRGSDCSEKVIVGGFRDLDFWKEG